MHFRTESDLEVAKNEIQYPDAKKEGKRIAALRKPTCVSATPVCLFMEFPHVGTVRTAWLQRRMSCTGTTLVTIVDHWISARLAN